MELAILHYIQDMFGNPFFDAFMPYFTYLGHAGALWVVVGLVLVSKREYRMWGIALLFSLVLVLVFNEVLLKSIVARPRPFTADPSVQLLVSPLRSYSFPSGHTGTAFAAATVLALSPVARGWKIAAWIVAVLLAFSRLYLFVHYPTDVVAGMVLGTLYGFIAVKVVSSLYQQRQARNTSTI